MKITPEQQEHADEIAPLLEFFLCIGAMYMEMHQDRDGMLAVQPHLTSLAKETAYTLAKSQNVRGDRAAQLVQALSNAIRKDRAEDSCRAAFEKYYRSTIIYFPAEERDRLLERRPTGEYKQPRARQEYILFTRAFEAGVEAATKRAAP